MESFEFFVFIFHLNCGSENMSKTINKVQCEVLLNRMLEKPEIARGFVRENREKVAEYWKQSTSELNSSGLPIKAIPEWKKVWTDQKRYVRKASSNKAYERGTGGGPNKTQKLSPAEESIFQLIEMKEAVEGVGNSKAFGLPPAEQEKVFSTEAETFLEIDALEEYEETCIGQLLVEAMSSSSQPHIPIQTDQHNQTRLNSKGKAGKMTTHEVVLKELEMQQDLCAKVGEAILVMENHNKEVQHGIKRVYRSLEHIQNQSNLKLKEMKRHNLEMEKLRKEEIESKIEKNRRMLEIENMKLDILRNKQD